LQIARLGDILRPRICDIGVVKAIDAQDSIGEVGADRRCGIGGKGVAQLRLNFLGWIEDDEQVLIRSRWLTGWQGLGLDQLHG
jgi:hypothetical protein